MRRVELSRNTPEFVTLGCHEARPLRDPYLSRRPIYLERVGDDGIAITPSPGVYLHVDEQRLESTLKLRMDDLRDGVMLQMARRVILLLHTISMGERPPGWGLVGESDGICQVRRQIAQVSDLDVPVLIRGETGVGKERVAQAIHAASKRADQPCIAVNMAAISPGTAASELFGHARGAFTGAIHRNVGLFERADRGTLFLDEIGETPSNIQAMLLRTLAEGTIMPVGGTEERTIDVRIIAATDANIEQGAADGTFRAALLHRLTGYEIRVPPLRERREDIPRLAVFFLEKELAEIGETWRLVPQNMSRGLWFPPELMIRLFRHDWPGNVRQLGNVVRQLVISSRGMAELHVDDSVSRTLSEGPTRKSHTSLAAEHRDRAALRSPRPAPRETRKLTDQEIYDALSACKWHVGPAAELLGIPRSTLYKLIERHPLIRKAKDISAEEIEECLSTCNGDIDRMADMLRVSPHGLRLRINELGMRPDKADRDGMS